MTSYRTTEVVVRRVEWAVAAGSNIADVNKVQEFAWQDYCTRTGTDRDSGRSDHWCHVHPRDEETVFAFEAEHKPSRAEAAVAKARRAITEMAQAGRLQVAEVDDLLDALSGAGVS